jgi:hypothetical protein
LTCLYAYILCRKIDTVNGNVTTFAGNLTPGW